MAGGDSAHGGRLACLRRADAEHLRRDLLALAATAAAGPVRAGKVRDGDAAAEAAAGGERLLFRVRPVRLPAAILFSRTGAVAVIVAAATCLTVALSGHTSTVAPFLPIVLGVAVNLWRQLNGEYGTTVTAARDGIRLRSGLIQTTAETIRPGRIQAVRLIEPVIWRMFGWCRLEVDVAGAGSAGRTRPRASGCAQSSPSDRGPRRTRCSPSCSARHRSHRYAPGGRTVEGAAHVPLPRLGL